MPKFVLIGPLESEQRIKTSLNTLSSENIGRNTLKYIHATFTTEANNK